MKLIKRYANRKLYDTERSCYITLDEISKMVHAGDDIQVVDQKSGDDLTSVTLAQIIYEEEKRTKRILPISALKAIIQSGGEFLQRVSQPVQTFREETQRSMDKLKSTTEVLDPRQFFTSIQRAIDEMQARVDERIKDAVDNLTHLPRVEIGLRELLVRLSALEDRVEKISRTVDRLWEHSGDAFDRHLGRK
jgi:polyhydroxyalkanoate synthesis repressor PhaR